MSKPLIFSKVALGIAALTLSSGIWASTVMDPVTATVNGAGEIVHAVGSFVVGDGGTEAEYLITDDDTGAVREADGVNCGKVVSDPGATMWTEDEVVGDTITDTRTHRSGTITGIADQGTMEVTNSNGQTVQYQYVTFKVGGEK
jgi:hypothetical protein